MSNEEIKKLYKRLRESKDTTDYETTLTELRKLQRIEAKKMEKIAEDNCSLPLQEEIDDLFKCIDDFLGK